MRLATVCINICQLIACIYVMDVGCLQKENTKDNRFLCVKVKIWVGFFMHWN